MAARAPIVIADLPAGWNRFKGMPGPPARDMSKTPNPGDDSARHAAVRRRHVYWLSRSLLDDPFNI
jgi:hypothetical protein